MLKIEPSNVICLVSFRRDKKRRFLIDNRRRLDDFFTRFITAHFKISFPLLKDAYQEHKLSQNELAWDYVDLREEIREAIRSVYGQVCWQDINKEFWFNRQMISFDEVIDRCTSQFVLQEDAININTAP